MTSDIITVSKKALVEIVEGLKDVAKQLEMLSQ